jgi:hypothetical protein
VPITVRDIKLGRDTKPGAAPVKRNIASLVGGVVIAVGCFVLCLLVAAELTAVTWPVVLGAAVLALAVGIWIRVADL